jgi:AcrR family transcriptional regulator
MLKAMIEVVAAGGYQAASVGRAVERAGVSRASFYEQFEDKEDCFLQAYDEAVARVGGEVLAAFGSEDRWRDRLRRASRAFLDFLREEPETARVLIVEVLAAGAEAVSRRNAVVAQYAALVDAGRQELEDPSSISPVVAEGVIGAIYEVVYGRIVRGEEAEFEALLPELMYLAVAPYLGKEAAAEELHGSG